MSILDQFKERTSLIYLAIPRFVIGYYYLRVGPGKLSDKFLSGQPLSERFTEIAADPFSWHHSFITDFVVPHAEFFAHLVAFGEVAIGVSLILGCLVRLSSSFGAFHSLNILLAIGIPAGGASFGVNLMFFVMQLMFVFSSPGRVLGLDGLLKKRFPKSRLF